MTKYDKVTPGFMISKFYDLAWLNIKVFLQTYGTYFSTSHDQYILTLCGTRGL